ncbi:YbfB/YjiJ family MFS transporter [Mycolicibacterium sp. YH-1]|uniref:YbfB/YjiJ family MFS transporter n=1 Tax=Mycolicibacterium sp. YH-1 TaxID=2908837 RepID=UPI001F4C2EB3|nr:YbfB/YjiJ family MFS transporter [Mycolicibacterium sp. YH-1]UNB53696.1 YbfB/YjiJ family MFS transporter [Mycolicibacterium sp. YH-1]
MSRQHAHAHIARGAAGLAAAMGIGRFVYTPILPLMTEQAGLSPGSAGGLATANYVGYLAGALAGVAAPRLVRTTATWRMALAAIVASLAAMPLTHNVIAWLAIRVVAGFASAVLFVIAVDWMLDHARGRSAQLPGWGFGGVGVGIALSGALVLLLPAAGWRAAWWTSAGLAALVAAVAWHMRGAPDAQPEEATSPTRQPDSRRWFVALFACYTLEGIGYIIAGTFLVAAIGQNSAGWLGNGAWIVVGVAAAPSAALWAWASTRWAHPTLLTAALVLQGVGIALPALAGGVAAALIGAVLFGGTFIGVSTIALAAGRLLAFPRAVAVLTSGYSVGQILGPLVVTPLLHQGVLDGFRYALVTSAVVVSMAALAAMWLRVRCPDLSSRPADAGRAPGATLLGRPASIGPSRP